MDIDEMKVLVVYLPSCHESLAGIIAGRLREKYYKPVFVLTDAEDGIKGSGRSIEGYDMHKELTTVKDLLTKYGGHTMAAGLSLAPENLEEFIIRLNKNSNLADEDFVKKIWIDTELPPEYLNMNFVESLLLLEPFGRGNEKPVFAARDITVTGGRIVGSKGNVLQLNLLTNQGGRISGICFEQEEFDYLLEKNNSKEKVSLLYYPQINEYNGNTEIKMQIKSVLKK
jgi:single-stranded-DNA-specific exonuclease